MMRINLSRFKLITFDVTGTLLQFRHSPGYQYGEVGALYGIMHDKEKLAQNFAQQWKKMRKEHPNFGLTSVGWEEWWRLVVFGCFKDIDADEVKLELISRHLIECYKTMACWEQSYGALGLLSFLRNIKMPLGIISNFDERLGDVLQSARIRHYFKFVVSSYEAGFEKPDARIFHKAICASGIPNLQPQDCLHIGDRYDQDIEGAKQSEWNYLLINDGNFPKIQKKFPELEEKCWFKNLHELHMNLTQDSLIK